MAATESAPATAGKCCRRRVAVGDAIVVGDNSRRFANSVPLAPGPWPQDRLSVRWCPAAVVFLHEAVAVVVAAGERVALRGRSDPPGQGRALFLPVEARPSCVAWRRSSATARCWSERRVIDIWFIRINCLSC